MAGALGRAGGGVNPSPSGEGQVPKLVPRADLCRTSGADGDSHPTCPEACGAGVRVASPPPPAVEAAAALCRTTGGAPFGRSPGGPHE